ncbi:hypothetical protein [Pseudoalteromonas sp. '520P1 No. 412']|uniref:hypothetical protein n=1 Tax=Pseudoalteromonas sp. '520P1 No. 412' TaxID=304208 RepID=UPI0005A7FB86|nr:hypothetical protein [Pseudoalteromonas sp. '520P1 No. 412']
MVLKHGTYDVNESVAATGIFSRIAGEIVADDEFEYMAKLNNAITAQRVISEQYMPEQIMVVRAQY